MFDEDAILQIRGPCDCDGGEGKVDDKNCGKKKKSKTTKSDGFF